MPQAIYICSTYYTRALLRTGSHRHQMAVGNTLIEVAVVVLDGVRAVTVHRHDVAGEPLPRALPVALDTRLAVEPHDGEGHALRAARALDGRVDSWRGRRLGRRLGGPPTLALPIRAATAAAAAAAGNTATANNRTLVHEIGGDNNIHQESFFDGRYVVVCLHKEGEMELKLPNELEHVDGCPINVLSLDQSCSLRTVSMYADNVFGCYAPSQCMLTMCLVATHRLNVC